jgi:hypothetical protein
MTTLSPSVSRLSGKYGSLDNSQYCRPLWPATWIALPYLWACILTLGTVTAPVSARHSQTFLFVLDRKSSTLNSKQTRAGKPNHNVPGA